jgi:PKD repeat protein
MFIRDSNSSIDGNPIGGVSGGDIVSYNWDFQSKIETIETTSNELSLTGLEDNIYNLVLEVTDENGCKGTVFKPSVVSVFPAPDANFSIEKLNQCGVGVVNFEAKTNFPQLSVSRYNWDINNDDIIEAELKEYSHKFKKTGSFPVGLTIISDHGCASEKVVKDVLFNDNNSVDFSFSNPCINQEIQFNDGSSESAAKWSWDFDGDEDIDSQDQNPSYTFSSPVFMR